MSRLPARVSDPSTSHEAAADIVSDGTQRRMQDIAYSLICESPGLTANELEAKYGYKEGQIRKRLHELAVEGLIAPGDKRRSAVSQKNCLTWYTMEQFLHLGARLR